jgi:flagellin
MQQTALGSSLEKLSTGLRSNRASDDAAGLSVSESMRARVRGLTRAKANTQDGIALLQIADGAAGRLGDIIQRMRELAVQSATDTLATQERSYTQNEFVHLLSEIVRITHGTNYNGMTLLDGEAGSFGGPGNSPSTLHVGADAGATANRIQVSMMSLTLGALGLSGDNDGDDDVESEPWEGEIVVSVDTAAAALSSILALDGALKSVNTARSQMGAYANRLEFAASNLDNQVYNTQDAESRIRDVDFASETADFTRRQILAQSATSMLAQANQAPQGVLGLLAR